MRITQKSIFSSFMRDVNKNRGEMARIQSDLSSGREVRKPSQDPVSFQSSRIIEGNIEKNEQFQSNINNGLRQGRLAQDSLDGVIDSLILVKNMMVKGASDSVGVSEREAMADKVSGIKKQIIDSLNAQYGDRYLFAGTNSGEKPFEQAGGVLANNSNDKPPHIVAADGVEIDISITGQDVVGTGAGDLFDIIGNAEEALRNNDNEALKDMLPDSDKAIEHVTNLASKLGDNINRMDFMFESYESLKISQKSDVSELVDTNYAEAFSRLQRNQVAYESAMAAHSKMFKNVLLNYI